MHSFSGEHFRSCFRFPVAPHTRSRPITHISLLPLLALDHVLTVMDLGIHSQESHMNEFSLFFICYRVRAVSIWAQSYAPICLQQWIEAILVGNNIASEHMQLCFRGSYYRSPHSLLEGHSEVANTITIF
jgi:hypothetical protein